MGNQLSDLLPSGTLTQIYTVYSPLYTSMCIVSGAACRYIYVYV